MPRVLAAFVVGGLLALSGTLLQALLRNPLADPYVLGVSGGAAVGSLLPILLGAGAVSSLGGVLGALVSVALVLTAARRGSALSVSVLLLAGVILASTWGAMIGLMLALAPDAGLRGMLFWLMGDLGDPRGLGWGFPILILALVTAMAMARPLDLLARGTLTAAVFGVATVPLELGIYLLSSLATATAVNLAGSIGFVGLLAPHFARLLIGTRHRILLPAATMLGGSLLALADAVARSVIAPRELPVGTMTALLGTPLFLWLLARRPQSLP
jgi:iron complex transport system permease protein